MNLKPIVILEFERNDRTYRFEMPVGAPYGEAYDAAFDVLKEITNLANKATENVKPVNNCQEGCNDKE